MTQVHFLPPPELEAYGDKCCQMCLMYAKGDQITRTREEWEQLVNDGNDKAKPKWFAYDEPGRVIREGVTRGISEMFPGVVLWLCWDHVGPLAPPDPRPPCNWCGGTGRKKGPTLATANGLPPGLTSRKMMGRG